MRFLFSAGVLVSACLLFLVQPMAAKMLLPSLGGSPAVWITCMVFFQAMLLAGYAYAHGLTSRLGARAQVAVHAIVLVVSLAALPIRIAPEAGALVDEAPVGWLLGALFASLAAPFFVLATTGPLLQRWFAATTHRDAGNPYFLYATSNVGSLAALLAYPLLLEPALRLGGADDGLLPRAGAGLSQSALWSLGYLVFAALCLAAGWTMLRRRAIESPAAAGEGRAGPAVGFSRRLLWVALAFVPSSAMLGATQYLTTDIAAVPLLWVLPLALYLLTFIVAFSARLRIPLALSSVGLALLALAVAALVWGYARPPILVAMPVHLLAIVAVGLVCHGRLWDERPAPSRLTEFYLWIAFGGVLGGVFNALVAPLIFRSVVEYPLAIVLAALLRPARVAQDAPARRGDLLWPLALAATLALVHVALDRFGPAAPVARASIEIAVGSALCLLWISRPARFALGLAVLFAAGWMRAELAVATIHVERTFFGVLKVARFEGTRFRKQDDPNQIVQVPMHVLFHGTTRHGTQLLDVKLRRRATAYFHVSGPIGHVYRTFRGSAKLGQVAIVGLGAGTLAAYGEAGQSYTFYEIDPAVVTIAENPAFFTYLADCRATTRMVVGDGRVGLTREPDGKFGLIVIDAFSSGAMPVHLMTREALALYFTKLRPDGLLVLNLTSQYFELRPVVAAIAEDLGLAGLSWSDVEVSWGQLLEGKDPSIFAVLARDPAVLAPLRGERRWIELPRTQPGQAPGRWLWTDDASSLLGAIRR